MTDRDQTGRPVRVDAVFAHFDRAGLRWMLLRPPKALEQPAGDIDLLVAPDSRDETSRLLARIGVPTLPMRSHGDIHAVDYDADSDRFLWWHIQSSLRLGPYTVPAREMLRQVVRDPLPRPTDAALFWILVLHGLLDKHDIAERHRSAVRSLATCADTAASSLRTIAARAGLPPDVVVALAAAGDWEALRRVASAPTAAKRSTSERVAGLRDRVGGLWTRRGVAVAVVGPDGAGKTTLVTALSDSLPFPTRALYMGLSGGRLPLAERLRIPGIVLAARVAIIWTRYSASLYHRARGRIVLFDRYLLDARVPSGQPLGRLGRLSRRIQGAACPPPNRILLLDASGSTLHERSAEYDDVELERWRKTYRRVAGRSRLFAVIDSEQPREQVLREAKREVWALYARRWLPRIPHGQITTSRKFHTRSG